MLKKWHDEMAGLLASYCLVALSCNKERSNDQVEIYLLKSFSIVSNPSTPETVTITQAKLEKAPLVVKSMILFIISNRNTCLS